MRRHRTVTLLVGLVAALGLAAGCTISADKGPSTTPAAGSGSIKEIGALKGVKLVVGSKEFDEQLLLGQIAIAALKATGADPVDKTNITGSDTVRTALTNGSIDLYWEYTGTGWVSFLKQTTTFTDPGKLYDAVRAADAKNSITWWPPAPANDTYAIAINSEAAAKYHVTTLSEYAALAKQDPAAASTCIGPEFSSRDDGFPGLQKAYGFTLPASSIHVLNDAVIYPTAGRGGTCNFGEVATTDGRVSAQQLSPLEDDKHFFPIYNPCITIRTSVAEKYPELEPVFTAIAQKLTTPELTALNKKVSVDGQKSDVVATEWLKSAGFIG
jgi:osmoprotectant transport system substrate-binding protein